jgi:hypothetical protein
MGDLQSPALPLGYPAEGAAVKTATDGTFTAFSELAHCSRGLAGKMTATCYQTA